MSLKKSLQNYWHDLVNHLQSGGESFFSSLGKSIKDSGGEVLKSAAFAAVASAEANGGSGEDKFKAACNAVIGILEAQGVKWIRVAVEGAVLAAVATLNDVQQES